MIAPVFLLKAFESNVSQWVLPSVDLSGTWSQCGHVPLVFSLLCMLILFGLSIEKLIPTNPLVSSKLPHSMNKARGPHAVSGEVALVQLLLAIQCVCIFPMYTQMSSNCLIPSNGLLFLTYSEH